MRMEILLFLDVCDASFGSDPDISNSLEPSYQDLPASQFLCQLPSLVQVGRELLLSNQLGLSMSGSEFLRVDCELRYLRT